MSFEGLKDFFGVGGEKKEEPAYNKEAKQQTAEAHALTGRETTRMSDDISTRQESAPATPEEREEKILHGIGEIMQKNGIHQTEVLGMEGYFVKELHKSGILSERDLQFNAEELVRGVLSTIARKEA